MELTRKQEEGLKIALDRYKQGEKYTVISGYAGTGKSTLVRFIIDALHAQPDAVAYATFTGKAAEVLRKKGNDNACTLHHLLYDFFPCEGGGFIRKPVASLDYDIIVVDEVSMAPKDMMDLLFSHPVYVICLGDPFQIPPIDKDNDNHLLDNPHIFLDEIMRQAAESEIIRLTMDIRAMKPLEIYKGTDVQVLPPSALVDGMLTWADEVLVATNSKRIQYNNEIRKMLGKGDLPEDGDKVICQRNYWEDCGENGDALVNGTIGFLDTPIYKKQYFPRNIFLQKKQVDVIKTNIFTDAGETFYNLNLDKQMMLDGEYSLDWRDQFKLNKVKYRLGDLAPKQFTYGYAITTHKAQGSEWDKVLVLEEHFPFDKTEHARWLYTAATRASQKLVIIKAD